MYSDGNKIGHRVRLYRHFQQYIDYTRLNGRRKKREGGLNTNIQNLPM